MFFLLFLLDDRRIRIRISDLWIRIRIQEAQKHVDPSDPDPQHCKEIFCLSKLDNIVVQLSKRAERAFLSRYNSRTVHAFIKSDAVQTVTGEDKVVLDRCGSTPHPVPCHTSGTAPRFRYRATLPVPRCTSGTAPHFRYCARLAVPRHTSDTAPHFLYRATLPVPRHTWLM
jgi:hypothetical protein